MLEQTMASAERCYDLAFEALPHLPTFYGRPMAVASSVYRGILDEIRRNDYDNLRKRAVTSRIRKSRLATRGLWRLKHQARQPRVATPASDPERSHEATFPIPH